MKFGFILVGILGSLLYSTNVKAACGCINYFEQQVKPGWVDTEQTGNGQFKTFGIARCTGLKQIDLKKAKQSATESLAVLLETTVQSKTELDQLKENNVVLSRTKNKARFESKAIIKGATVYDNWIDSERCLVYSAIVVSDADIKNALQAERKLQNQRLKAQTFFVKNNEPQLDYLAHLTLTQLSDMGLMTTDKLTKATVVIDITEASKPSFRRRRADVIVSIRMINVKKDEVFKQNILKGKGISFRNESMDVLSELAFDDVSEQFGTVLKKNLDVKL
ncbi:hypothetical protein ACFFK7_16175 [Pseudoalteromonas xiamenensis]|uniref:hypothetical protein n=1 Tax=Pseudoalteromonas xiamenensis TaxID=882626 RepID=UPI0035EE4644